MIHFDYRIDIHDRFERESRHVCHLVAMIFHVLAYFVIYFHFILYCHIVLPYIFILYFSYTILSYDFHILCFSYTVLSYAFHILYLSYTFRVIDTLFLVLIYLSSHSNAMLLISCHVLLSFSNHVHILVICFIFHACINLRSG